MKLLEALKSVFLAGIVLTAPIDCRSDETDVKAIVAKIRSYGWTAEHDEEQMIRVSLDADQDLPDDAHVTDKEMSFVCSTPRLRAITTRYVPLQDHHLRILGNQQFLREVRLSSGSFTDDGIAELKNAGQFLTFGLESSVIHDSALARLPPMPELHHFKLWGIRGDGKSLMAIIQAAPKLLDVRLLDAGANDDVLATIASCRDLKVLAIWSAHISDQGVEQLKTLAHLERLELLGPRLTAATTSTCAKIPTLRKLRVNYLNDASLLDLADVKNLEEIRIDFGYGAKVSLPMLREFRRLKPDVDLATYDPELSGLWKQAK